MGSSGRVLSIRRAVGGSPGTGELGGGAHLHALGAGQQHSEPLGELFKRVADGEARLADVHSLHHAGVTQLLDAQLAVEELRV